MEEVLSWYMEIQSIAQELLLQKELMVQLEVLLEATTAGEAVVEVLVDPS